MAELRITITDEEKALIKELAKEENMSVSAYVKMCTGIGQSWEQKYNTTVSPDYIPVPEYRNKRLLVSMTETEYEKIKKEANAAGLSLSSLFVRKAITAKNIINIKVEDNDVENFKQIIFPQLSKIRNTIELLKIQKQLNDNQYNTISSTLTELTNVATDFLHNTIKHRKSLSNRELNLLNKKVNQKIAEQI